MAQFDVYELRGDARLVVSVQSDLISSALDSRLVIPLLDPAEARWPFARLTPLLRFDGKDWILGTPLMIGIPKKEIGSRVGSLQEHGFEIMNAIDFLLTGV